MKTEVLNVKGTQMNKVDFYDLEELFEAKGISVRKAESEMLNTESSFVYVSNGFLSGLTNENTEINEWHHYFLKQEDGTFEAFKLNFYNV